MVISRLCLVSSFLVSMVSAVDMLVQTSTMICDNRRVKASFSYVCSAESLCTLGETQSVQGSFIYDGLVSYYNVSDADYFYVDAKISLGIGGITTFSHQLVDMAQVPVCNQFTANDYNMYGDCPADGRYSYEAQYNFPAPSSDLMSWATTGYEGDITLDIYLGNTELVGRCVIGAKTMVTGSYEKGTFESVPSGMIATIVVMSITLLLCMYIVCLLVKSCRSKRVENRKSLEAEPDEEPTSSYNRMVEAGVDEDITPASSAVSRADTRYSADGALI